MWHDLECGINARINSNLAFVLCYRKPDDPCFSPTHKSFIRTDMLHSKISGCKIQCLLLDHSSLCSVLYCMKAITLSHHLHIQEEVNELLHAIKQRSLQKLCWFKLRKELFAYSKFYTTMVK